MNKMVNIFTMAPVLLSYEFKFSKIKFSKFETTNQKQGDPA